MLVCTFIGVESSFDDLTSKPLTWAVSRVEVAVRAVPAASAVIEEDARLDELDVFESEVV